MSELSYPDGHWCEPYNAKEWVCIYCGELFPRRSFSCAYCVNDPQQKSHTCEFNEIFLEGDCDLDDEDTLAQLSYTR